MASAPIVVVHANVLFPLTLRDTILPHEPSPLE